MRRRLLLAPSRLPCTPPPFGALVAIDLRTGQRKWEVPLGSMVSVLAADVVPQTKSDWGSINLGGATASASGVVFVGAALDRRLHAYDIETGRELWQGELPASAKATPMMYRLPSGTEYVAVAVGGGGAWGAGDYVVAFVVKVTQVAEVEEPNSASARSSSLGRSFDRRGSPSPSTRTTDRSPSFP